MEENLTNKQKKQLHKKLHIKLRDSNLLEVKQLIELYKLTLCHDKFENCFTIAQDNKNSEFLTFLLEYDPSGINVIDSDGDSLLMRDINEYKSRHAELLLNKGADANYINPKNDISVLYSAIENKSTPINIIEKLLKCKADVNYSRYHQTQGELDRDFNYFANFIYYQSRVNDFHWDGYLLGRYWCKEKEKSVNWDTPLHCLLKNYNKFDGAIEKVKLLIKYGANINFKNDIGRSPLMIASSLSFDLNLIKYLIDNGAKTNGMEDILGFNALNLTMFYIGFLDLENLPRDEIIDLFQNYYIPVINILVEAGDDLFLLASNRDSPLKSSLYLERRFRNTGIDKIIIHLIKLAFEKLSKGIKIEENENHINPIFDIFLNFSTIMNFSFFHEISKIILSHSSIINIYMLNENTATVHFLIREIQNINPIRAEKVSFFIAPFLQSSRVKLSRVNNWFRILLKNKIILSHEDRLVLLNIFLLEVTHITRASTDIKNFINYMINVMGVYVNATKLTFNNSRLNAYQKFYFNVPDCIIISALAGNIEFLKIFLPYWNQHPLTVILFLCPWLEKTEVRVDIITVLEKIIPFLYVIGGALSHGTKLFGFIQRYLLDCVTKDPENLSLYVPIVNVLHNIHSSPASLQILCRTVIRNNAVGHGNNLPSSIKSLVPSNLLKNFLALTENYDDI